MIYAQRLNAVRFLSSASPIIFLLCGLGVAAAQTTSTSIRLEGTQWRGRSIYQANIDGSSTALTTTYAFETQGKVTLTIVISRGIGISTIAMPFGSIPYATSLASEGTYEISRRSVHIDLPDRVIDATISVDGMKGMMTTRSNATREEWVARNSPSETPNSSPSISDNERERRSKAIHSWMAGDNLCIGTGNMKKP
jgi:hypothetical protein